LSNFACKVRSVRIEVHPNADLLEIGLIDGYQFIVAKGQFQNGDLGVYIPEQAIVPAPLIQQMGLEGKLAGSESNRVKAIRLRGVVSQGLFYRPMTEWPSHWVEGLDVAQELGIIKWEPPIPIEMAGEVEAAPSDTIFRTYTDVEDIKKYPNVLVEGEEVVITEKLHGSCTIVGILNGQRVASSKGIAGKQLVIREREGNVYWRVAIQEGLFAKLERYLADTGQTQVLLFGEVLGVQDLLYGLKKGALTYRAFDLYTESGWQNPDVFGDFCATYGVLPVPILYQGAFSKEILAQHTSGSSTLANHLREGVVVRPVVEREQPEVGRVILKSVSADYLLRKGGTELN